MLKILTLTLAVAFELVADYCLKRWSMGGAWALAAAGSLAYGMSGLAWGFYLRHDTLQRAIVLFTMTNLLGALLIGRIFFGETLETMELAGAFFAMLAVALIVGAK